MGLCWHLLCDPKEALHWMSIFLEGVRGKFAIQNKTLYCTNNIMCYFSLLLQLRYFFLQSCLQINCIISKKKLWHCNRQWYLWGNKVITFIFNWLVCSQFLAVIWDENCHLISSVFWDFLLTFSLLGSSLFDCRWSEK